MNESNDKEAAAGVVTDRFSLPGWLIGLVAAVIMIGYGILSYSMLGLAKDTNPAVNWDRAVLIFRSVEALAFAAAGVVLGVQIQRGQVQAMESRLQQTNAEFQRKARAVKEMVTRAADSAIAGPASGAGQGGGVESASQPVIGPAGGAMLKNLQTAIDAML